MNQKEREKIIVEMCGEVLVGSHHHCVLISDALVDGCKKDALISQLCLSGKKCRESSIVLAKFTNLGLITVNSQISISGQIRRYLYFTYK